MSMRIIGGNQMNNNLESSQCWVQTQGYGFAVSDQVPNPQQIATGQSWSPLYRWGNSHLNVFLYQDPFPFFGYIVGGLQENSDADGEAPWVPTVPWGSQGGTKILIATAHSWSRSYGWGNSRISFFTSDQRPQASIVGGYQEFNNMEMNQDWLMGPPWGTVTRDFIKMAELQAYSDVYGWGHSRVSLYLG